MSPSIEIDIAFSRPGLIVLDEHGAVYTSQVFGNSCEQVAARGFFVPLDETFPEFIPEPVEEALGKLLANAPYLSEREADEVDALLARYGETEFLRVDRTMLAESGEAWVYVDVIPRGSCPLSGSGPWKGILVWANSD
ncbi:DUF6210 family protein [Nannocystis punicea]|uniref:DUF6210 family protein n=1 Tax=Nannocystis punicea TaxID=2995304 RepID=A0ABY7HAN2_9BACT|nr:DUF6210 family protein [Nannocystis poenicansa]WAS96321.1 DUF6210 family protein [Nannocystis poenicansa]